MIFGTLSRFRSNEKRDQNNCYKEERNKEHTREEKEIMIERKRLLDPSMIKTFRTRCAKTTQTTRMMRLRKIMK